MDFSEVFPGVTISLFSPDSQFVVLSNGTRVIVKHTQTLSTLPFSHSQFGDSPIAQIEFSPDSSLIALSYPKRGYVEIRKTPSLDDDEQLILETQNWIARIDDSAGGVAGIKWAPDSLQLLIYSDFQQKISIYNLNNKSICYIRNPKYTGEKGTAFSHCGKFMALAERRDAKDFIGIYFTKDWKLLNYQQVDTNDLANLEWASNDSCIAIWDSEINYRVLIHCPCQGLLMKFQPYDFALGVKSLEFSKRGDILAVGSYDEKVRLINLVSLRLITELDHKPQLTQYKDIIVYKEEEFKDKFAGQKLITKYVNVEPQQCKIQVLKVQPNQANPPQGVGLLQWSHDDTYLASRNDNMPNVLWIWEVQSLELRYVLIQIAPIKTFKWAGNCKALVICTGQNKIYFWSPSSTSACDMPYEGRSYNVQNVEWSRDQKCLLLFEKSDAVIAYPQMEVINQQEFRDDEFPDFQ